MRTITCTRWMAALRPTAPMASTSVPEKFATRLSALLSPRIGTSSALPRHWLPRSNATNCSLLAPIIAHTEKRTSVVREIPSACEAPSRPDSCWMRLKAG